MFSYGTQTLHIMFEEERNGNEITYRVLWIEGQPVSFDIPCNYKLDPENE